MRANAHLEHFLAPPSLQRAHDEEAQDGGLQLACVCAPRVVQPRVEASLQKVQEAAQRGGIVPRHVRGENQVAQAVR